MLNFRLLAIGAIVLILAGILELVLSNILFAAGCLGLGFALAVVVAYGKGAKPS